MRDFIIIVAFGWLVYYIVTPDTDKVDYAAVKRRHDIVKAYIGDLDDKIVDSGIISDATLHKIGAALGICFEKPGGAD